MRTKFFVALLFCFTVQAETALSITPQIADSPYVSAVRQFADQVLEHGRDVYGDTHSPLFVDGIDIRTGDPVVWRYDGDEWILSNFASQQNLMRVLTSLSALTGDKRYREAAEAAAVYMFQHQRDDCGLLYWGGHQIIDLKTLQNIGHFDANCHELKNNIPFYEFLWEVDPKATTQYLRAFWNAHMFDWGVLDMNRHGPYGKEMGPLWDHTFHEPEPFFEGRGLTFINTGVDLIHAGATLYALAEEQGALQWALRLAEQYVRARHPETGLGAYQYSKPERRQDPPADGPLTERLTWSSYGDRAENQFGHIYGDVAREGWVVWRSAKTVYVLPTLVQLELAEKLGNEGQPFIQWTVDGLRAFIEHAYDPEENHFRPMWADGTDLTGQSIQRTGYYGQEGTPFRPTMADADFLFAFARAFRLSQEEFLWDTIRSIMRGLQLGELGETPNDPADFNHETQQSDATLIFALIELAKAVDEPSTYLSMANRIADTILDQRFFEGYFLPSAQHVNASFDAIEPLALLSLEAAHRSLTDAAPIYSGGRGYIHGRYDGHGRTYDRNVIWNQRR